jgi:DNA-directed RNA polymerase subunit beta
MSDQVITQKFFSKYREPLAPLPNLVENQIDSYRWFIEKGLQETIKEFFPITDYSEKKFELKVKSFELIPPEFDEYHAKKNKLSYDAQLKAVIELNNKTLKDTKEQEIFLSDVPFMTPHGTFIINGVERVIVPQLARSYGVFFTEHDTKNGKKFGAKIIPERGAWIEMETEKDGVIQVRIDKKRKFPVTTLLRAFGLATEKEILAAFKGNDISEAHMKDALERDSIKTQDEAFVEIYKKLRDGEIATVDNGKEFFNSIFGSDRYDLSRVGRYHFNKRFDLGIEEKDLKSSLLTVEDLKIIINKIAELNTTEGAHADDIDHLGSRRVRYVGELVQQKVRKGMSQMKRNVQDRMSTIDNETMLPINLINQRPLQARIKEFFATNQLSQFMNQENTLGEIEHLRILSALGPGGLTRERAGFEVRDVHPSHYGRVCPIHTPEGPNIGLVLHLSMYARINEFGMIETPYVKVNKGKITGEIMYLNAMEEEKYNIAHAGIAYDAKTGKIEKSRVEGRRKTDPGMIAKEDVDFIDVATNQAFSVATALVPFLENDDANRALMGSNMMKQATPCIRTMAPLVATGMESKAARDTGRVVLAEESGSVVAVDARKITIKGSKKEKTYPLVQFLRTNNSSLFHQRPLVTMGQKVKKGDVIADCSTTDRGQLAIGQNVLVAFMCWSGNNFEDAIIISERLVKNSIFTSVRIEEYECVVRDTKLGAEVTTHDIPNVGESKGS